MLEDFTNANINKELARRNGRKSVGLARGGY